MPIVNTPLSMMQSKVDQSAVKDILQTQFSSKKTKINDDVSAMMAELAHIIVMEAAQRASKIAKQEESSNVTLDHIEAVLPQLMLDLP